MGDDTVLATSGLLSKYKIQLRYGGYFRFAKNSSRKKYCFGYQKCLYIDTYTYNWDDLIQEVKNRYPSDRNFVFTILFVDKHATEEGSFIKLDSHENFQVMLTIYEVEKELSVYVSTGNDFETSSRSQRVQVEATVESHNQDESEYSLSDESYHSRYSSDSEIGMHYSQQETFKKKSPTIKVKSTFDNVIVFRRALIHYALINEFEYFLEKSDRARVTASCVDKECKWRMHASVKQNGITFEVKTFVENHSCIRSNKGGNKVATQGWIASVVKDKLKSEGDVSTKELQMWVMTNYNVDVSYDKVRRGKEQAYVEIYGKWEDSFMKMNDFKKEILRRNPGSVVDIDYERDGNNKRFLRFFISLIACSRGFLKDQWIHVVTDKEIYPPNIKRPPGRPRKNRIKPNDEPKKRRECKRCGGLGNLQKTCKNPASQGSMGASQNQPSTNKRRRGKSTKNPAN